MSTIGNRIGMGAGRRRKNGLTGVGLALGAALLAPLPGLHAQSPAPAPSPPGAASRAQEAGLQLLRGDLDAAVRLYTEALAEPDLTNDRRAILLSDRGVALGRLGQSKAAIEDFNRAVQLYPELAAIYNNRGTVLLTLGLMDEALKDFERAIVLSPGYASAFSNRAVVLMRLGRHQEAIRDFTKAIELTPSAVAALSGRGRAHLALGRPHAAIRDFTRAVNADPRSAAAYRGRAEAQIAAEKFTDAVADLSRAQAFDPGNVEIYLVRGHAYLAARNPASAIKDFARALELDPKSAAAMQGRGIAHAKAEAYDEALNDLAQAIELDQRSPVVYAYRAWVYKQMGQAELGQRDVERALRLAPTAPESLWARAEIAEALGRAEEAIADLRKVVAQKPGLRDAVDALVRLGADIRVDGTELAGRGIGPWRVVGTPGQYFATSPELPRLRVPLEMLGEGQPRLLEWDLKPDPFKGIGVLRFEAGSSAGPAGSEEMEQAAIIDIQAGTILALEPVKRGKLLARWTWEDGKVTVASVDGLTTELAVRSSAKAKDVVTAQPRRGGDQAPSGKALVSGPPPWAPWAQSDQPRGGGSGRSAPQQKPKSLFDLFFPKN